MIFSASFMLFALTILFLHIHRFLSILLYTAPLSPLIHSRLFQPMISARIQYFLLTIAITFVLRHKEYIACHPCNSSHLRPYISACRIVREELLYRSFSSLGGNIWTIKACNGSFVFKIAIE